MRPLALLTAAVAAACLAALAPAAEFRVDGDTMWLDGPLVREDVPLFRRFLEANPQLKRLSINSPGGDLAAGIEMGELVRQRKLETYVEAGVREAGSAAAYIFMSGAERVVKGGRGVGVHAFYTPQQELRRMIKQKSGEELLRTLNEFERRTQEGTVAVVEFVTRMIGDTRILREAVRTGSDAMFWPDARTLVEWKVATRRIDLKPEEIPDLAWVLDELTAELAVWLDDARPDALSDRGRAMLESLLFDPDQSARLRNSVEGELKRVAPANRDVAMQRLILPIADDILRQIREAAAAAEDAEAAAREQAAAAPR